MLEVKDMRIACSSLAFSRQSLEESFQRIAALGFRYVDVGIQENWAHINPSDIERDLVGVKERLDRAYQRHGLTLITSNVGLGTEDRSLQERRLEAVCELLATYEIESVTIQSSNNRTPFASEISRLCVLRDIAQNEGLRLSIETHMECLTENAEIAVELAKQAKVGLTVDPTHYLVGPWRGKDFDFVYQYAAHVHLRDTGATMEQVQTPVNRGVMDFPQIVSRLEESGYEGDITIEYIDITPDIDTGEEARKLKAILKKLVAEEKYD